MKNGKVSFFNCGLTAPAEAKMFQVGEELDKWGLTV